MGLLGSALAAGANFFGNLFGANRQQKNNMKLAKYQHKSNMELLKYQLDYNTPDAQMQRFRDAGLNPNLIYGQGTSGNMESVPRYPDIQPADYQSAFGNLGTQFQQSRLLSAQADLTRMKVDESGVKQDLMKAQENLAKANPYLQPGYVDSMATQLRSIARMKEQQADFLVGSQMTVGGRTGEPGLLKMQRELELLDQKFNLGNADQKVKAEIIKSKDFQNQLLKIQNDWMKDAEITPQHIYQFIMMLFAKMM